MTKLIAAMSIGFILGPSMWTARLLLDVPAKHSGYEKSGSRAGKWGIAFRTLASSQTG
jgi:hypothetical protein